MIKGKRKIEVTKISVLDTCWQGRAHRYDSLTVMMKDEALRIYEDIKKSIIHTLSPGQRVAFHPSSKIPKLSFKSLFPHNPQETKINKADVVVCSTEILRPVFAFVEEEWAHLADEFYPLPDDKYTWDDNDPRILKNQEVLRVIDVSSGRTTMKYLEDIYVNTSGKRILVEDDIALGSNIMTDEAYYRIKDMLISRDSEMTNLAYSTLKTYSFPANKDKFMLLYVLCYTMQTMRVRSGGKDLSFIRHLMKLEENRLSDTFINVDEEEDANGGLMETGFDETLHLLSKLYARNRESEVFRDELSAYIERMTNVKLDIK